MSPEYLAGIFDGEGCIDVQRMYPQSGKGRLYVRPRMRMCMANSSIGLAHLLHTKFGGHLAHRKAGKTSQQDSWSLEWLSGAEMHRILNLILPHLILKAEQARLILWWLDNASGRQRSKVAGMEQAREAFVLELRAMKADPQRLSERAAEHIASLMR